MTIGKNENRKDKYGNLLASDEALKIGIKAMKDYIAESDEYAKMSGRTAHEYLKTSNIYVDALMDVASEAIDNAGLDPELDLTYTDYDEMIGNATGDEIKIENSKWACKWDAWTGHKYNGYKTE